MISEIISCLFDKNQFISNKINLYYKNKFIVKKMKNNVITKKTIEWKNGGFEKIYANLKTRICHTFRKYDITHRMSYEKMIGCTADELEMYITKLLHTGMTIENYGEWEIDHIIPISSFNLHELGECIKCFNYLNLQPLWKIDNIKKSNKIMASTTK